MPLDKRLYMTFPNDFWMHPKIAPLSDAAFRAFVEMNGYSRMLDLDGRISVKAAHANWKRRALTELLENHPERPSLSVDGDDYVIHNYEQHQETRAARAARVATNTANGRLGGRPKKNREETQSVTDSGSETEPNQKESQSQSQRSEIDVTHLSGSGTESYARDPKPDRLMRTQLRASELGVKDLPATRTMLAQAVGEPVSLAGAVELVVAVLSLAKSPVKDVDAYVATACRNSPAEVQRAYFDLDVEGVA